MSMIPHSPRTMAAHQCCGVVRGGRHHLHVLVGDLADRCGAVGLCVRELHLRTKEVTLAAQRHTGAAAAPIAALRVKTSP
jgi:hypothetical protein